uniref:Transmembrane protein n=1 Tax=Heterorhabditis bacteriophora TaxID=37862 RepID=A0A1I7WFL3_HETBA
MADERRMLSRFGVWLMAALCPPNETADKVYNSLVWRFQFRWICFWNSLYFQIYIFSASPGSAPALQSTERTGVLHFQTAKVEEADSDEFVDILPSEEVETAMAHATTLTEIDVGRETCHVVTSSLVEGIRDGTTPVTPLVSRVPQEEFWATSVGRFRFSLDQLSPQLKMIHALLSNFL